MGKTWGDVFNFHKRQGHDPSSAAVKADEWQKRQPWARCPSTHCERSQECRSPNECSASKQLECASCHGSGIVGYPPDDYFNCPNRAEPPAQPDPKGE